MKYERLTNMTTLREAELEQGRDEPSAKVLSAE